MQIENAVGRRESTKKISVDLREKIRKLVHADIRRLKAQMNAENKFA